VLRISDAQIDEPLPRHSSGRAARGQDRQHHKGGKRAPHSRRGRPERTAYDDVSEDELWDFD